MGQYIHAVIAGWQVPPVPAQPRLRAALERWAEVITPAGLHARLALLDPAAAAKIDYRNLRRTVRALEVILTSGRRFSEQRRRQAALYRTFMLGLTRPRPELYARIDVRIQAMLDAGLVAEVSRLLAQGYSPDLPTLSAIGYRQIVAHLQGDLPLNEAVRQMRRQTRVFVRRQANWFKETDPAIHWFQAGVVTLAEIEGQLRAWLAGAN
jgi:tRNA dimethylallyltransferase